MMNKNEIREYKRLRATGWVSRDAYRAAKVRERFARCVELKQVRLDIREDQDPDLSFLEQDCFASSRASEYQRANNDGVWGIVGMFRDANGEWCEGDAVWGFIGDDWKDSGYDIDVMGMTLDARVDSLAGSDPFQGGVQ